MVFIAIRKDDLYIMPRDIQKLIGQSAMLNMYEKAKEFESATQNDERADMQDLMHQRLGHTGVDAMKKLQDHQVVIGMDHFKVDVSRNRRSHVCKGCYWVKLIAIRFEIERKIKLER